MTFVQAIEKWRDQPAAVRRRVVENFRFEARQARQWAEAGVPGDELACGLRRDAEAFEAAANLLHCAAPGHDGDPR